MQLGFILWGYLDRSLDFNFCMVLYFVANYAVGSLD